MENYNSQRVAEWIERDCGIYEELELPNEAIEKIYSGNLLRFIGENK